MRRGSMFPCAWGHVFHPDSNGIIPSLYPSDCILQRNCYGCAGYKLVLTALLNDFLHSSGSLYFKVDYFQIGKGVCQGCILSPCLFNSYAEYIMRNTGLDEAQAGIKITGRNINSFRYAYDTTFMAESEEELKSLLMKVKEESEKVDLKLNIQKTKIMASGPITSWQIDGETVADYFFGLPNHCRWWLQPQN